MGTSTALLIIAASGGAMLAVLAAIALRLVRQGTRPRSGDAEALGVAPAATGSPMSALDLQVFFDSITDDICIIDRDYRICHANKSYADLVGLPLEQFIGTKCHAVLWRREEPCEQCPARESFASGAPVLRKKNVLRQFEAQRHLELSAYPVLDDKGKAVRAIEFLRDMTEEAHMLDQLMRSERLAGIGVMTTGIAHEMNNALSGIAGTASNLLTMPEKFGLNEKAVNRIFSIMDSASRATSVMKNLLQFSSPLQEETRVMVNVKQLLKKLVKSVYTQEAPDIERRVEFDDAILPIRADFSKVELVFMNVISNAIRSIQQMKKRCAKEGRDFKGVLTVCARLSEGSILVTVTDNGVGIEEKIGSKIFDPFFSVWPEEKGTGLGLSTALHVVEEHGGRISFECAGGLTTFSILLPVDRRNPFDVAP